MHLALIGDELFIRGFSTWGNQGLKPHSVGYSIPNFATIPNFIGTRDIFLVVFIKIQARQEM